LAIVKNKTTEANRKYWAHIEEVAKEVGKWPAWMIGRKTEKERRSDFAGRLSAMHAEAERLGLYWTMNKLHDAIRELKYELDYEKMEKKHER